MARALRSSAKAARALDRSTTAAKHSKHHTSQAKQAKTGHVQGKPSTQKDSRTKAGSKDRNPDETLASGKWDSWSCYATSTPFPDFGRPTKEECESAYRTLHKMHHEDVEREFDDPNTPETIPNVLDAMLVAILSQATSWLNAKRAMNSMKTVYGSMFNYDGILAGGRDKLQETIRCGGLHVRKSMIIMSMLQEVQERYGNWDLNHLLEKSDEYAMKELLSYKYMGPKSASVVMGWCLKRNRFTVDTHIYRIAGLWGWRPEKASREQTQSHLDATIPPSLKFELHFLLIAHGRACPGCRGGSKDTSNCEVKPQLQAG